MSESNNATPQLLLPEFTLSHLKDIAEQHGIRIGGGGSPPKLNEYDLYITHCATPTGEREADELTDKDFSRKYNVSQVQLWRWSKRKGFEPEVKVRRKAWAQSRVPDVLAGLYKRAVKTGEAKAVGLFLEYAEGFKSKVLGNDGQGLGNEYTMDDVRRMISFLPPDRQKFFTETIIQIFNEATEYARRAEEAHDSDDGGHVPEDQGVLREQADKPA